MAETIESSAARKPVLILFRSAGRALLAVLSVVVVSGCVEVWLGVTGYQKYPPAWMGATGELRKREDIHYWALSPSRIYQSQPNRWFDDVFRSDRFGFRYSTISAEISRPDVTIVMIGDSHTFGHNLRADDAYPEQVERLLADSGVRAKVYNAGVQGYGADQEYLYARDYLIPELRPDLLVWNIHVNDIWDSNEFCLFRCFGPHMVQFPALFNTMYMQGYMERNTPDILYRLNLYKLVFNLPTMVSHSDRWTFGCSLASRSDERLFAAFADKFTYFIGQIKAAFPAQKILLVLVPQQWLYVPGNKDQLKSEYVLLYDELRRFLGSQPVPFADANTVSVGKSGSGTVRVLGASVGPAQIDKDMFLKDGFPTGESHLTIEGNRQFARIILPSVRSLIVR